MYKKLSRMASIVCFSFLFSAAALAQFEVSPDHFDAPVQNVPQKAQHSKTVHKTTAAKRTPPGVDAKRKQLVAQRRKPKQHVATQNKTKAS